MKKLLIIILSVIVLAIAGVFGFIYYHSIPSKEYKTERFSFKVPYGFKVDSGSSLVNSNEYVFESMGAKISVDAIPFNDKIDTTGAYRNFHSTEKHTVYDKLIDSPYNGYFFSSERYLEVNGDLNMGYIINADTYFLHIYADCKPSAEKRVKRVLERIVKSIKYKSDDRIANKPDVYDFDYISINTGSKYICTDRTNDITEGPYRESTLIVKEQFAEIDNADKLFYPYVAVSVKKEYDSSPAELADKSYNSTKEHKEKYTTVIRDQQEMFGINCEHIYIERKILQNDDKKYCISFERYLFEKDGLLYEIFASYHADTDKADIEEMLDGITIKDIK